MKNLEILSLPVCLVNRRWLKDAKDYEYLNIDKERIVTHPQASQNWRYGTISKQVGITAYLASLSHEAFERAMERLCELNTEVANMSPDINDNYNPKSAKALLRSSLHSEALPIVIRSLDIWKLAFES
ncbi:hypothetical protein M5689_020731 [Euphorbia peplus]|nr:hypothetical protein M5689_020731 [Euphorbia peplus]